MRNVLLIWGTTKSSDNMLLKEAPEQLPVLCFYLLVDSEAAAVCWVTVTVRCCLSAETTFCQAGLMFLLRLWCSPGFFNFLMRVSVQGRIWRVATPTRQGRKTESWQLQVLMQMINVTKEITRHRLKWFVSCGCVTTVWCVVVRFCRRSNDWQMIIFLLTRYVNDFHLCGNVGSVLLHITQFVLVVSSSETEYVAQLSVTYFILSPNTKDSTDFRANMSSDEAAVAHFLLL